MTRRLFTDSGRKRIVKNRSGRKEENDNKQKSNIKKRMTIFSLSLPEKKKRTFSLFEGWSATPGTKFNQACHTALLMFRRSEMSSVGSSVIPVSYATSIKLFFLNSYSGRNIYFMFPKWLSVSALLHPVVFFSPYPSQQHSLPLYLASF